MNKIFSELIRVAIGNAVCLSHTPTATEWKELYAMAKKQSLVGICFAGVQRLVSQRQAPPEQLYLQWMGMAAKIQQRNEVVNQQCVDLQKRLSADGWRSCILKGQGVAALYKFRDKSLELKDLSSLRQSGDIDIWIDGDRDEVYSYLENKGIKVWQKSYVEAFAEIYNDTVVEVHSRPSHFYDIRINKRFVRFVESERKEQFLNFDTELLFSHPTIGFNLVFVLVHIYRHIFIEGVGMRQLLDYYFVFLHSTADERQYARQIIKELRMEMFLSAVLYVLHHTLALPQEYLMLPPDQKEGERLLSLILKGGNLGKYDATKKRYENEQRFLNGIETLKNNLANLFRYPAETISMPFWKVGHYIWRLRKGYI